MGVAFLLSCLMGAGAMAAPIVEGNVVGVHDGDTLTILDAHRRMIRVRLAEIDAPEKGQAFGAHAKHALSQLCFGRRARIQVVNQDAYGRTVGRVTCGGQDASAEQVRRGLAWVYVRYASDPVLYRLEREARAARRGLWQDPEPTPPWAWRRAGREGGRA